MDFLRDAKPVSILIVDDHPNTAAMLARVLSKFESPVEILTASGGEEALRMIGDRCVDILITDFMMPGVNGLELIEELKGNQKPAHTILITAYDTPGLAISARRLNVQDYLVKPVQPERIRGIVGKVIEGLRPAAAQIGAGLPQKEFKIIVADDNPDNLRLLSARLQNEGYTFFPSWDGEETILKIRELKPDLVLLDVNMPKKDGFQVLEEMRSDPLIAHIPVIIITAARIGPKDIREGLVMGADDYVIKPFDWRELAARIHSKLRVKLAEDILRQRNEEFKVFQEISQELTKAKSLEDITRAILDRIQRVYKTTCVRLDIIHEVECNIGYCQYLDGSFTKLPDGSKDQFLNSILISRAISDKAGVFVEDSRKDTQYGELTTMGISSLLLAPILNRDRLLGLLSLINDCPIQWSVDQHTFLQTIASQAALAIENIQNIDSKTQIAQEVRILKEYLIQINNQVDSQLLLEKLPTLTKQLSTS